MSRRHRRGRTKQGPAAPWDEIELSWWLSLDAEADAATLRQIVRRLPAPLGQAVGMAWRTSLLAEGPTPDRPVRALPAVAMVVAASYAVTTATVPAQDAGQALRGHRRGP